VACSAVSQALTPWPVRAMRLGDGPGLHAVRHGRVACPARGLAHGVPAPYDRADLACAGVARGGGPGVSVTVWPCRVTVPPAVRGTRQQGAPEVAAAPTSTRWRLARVAGLHPAWWAEARGRCWWTSRVRRRCPVQRRPVGVSHLRRGRPRSASVGHVDRVTAVRRGARHRPDRFTPAPVCRWRAQKAGPCVWAEVACRGGSLGISRDVADPEAGVQRGPTKHWSRPRQW